MQSDTDDASRKDMLVEIAFCCRPIYGPPPFLPTSLGAAAPSAPEEIAHHHTVTIPSPGGEPSPLHRIHVRPLLTEDEAAEVLGLARRHAADTRCWDRPDEGRHASYRTVDFAVEDAPDVSEYLLGPDGIGLDGRVFGELSGAYGVDAADMEFLDLFVASYEGKGGADDDTGGDTSSGDGERDTIDSLELHRDGSLLSFTVLLSPPDDFEAGGTVFDALRDVDATSSAECGGGDPSGSVLKPGGVIRPPRAGYGTLHSGKLLHGGERVTRGQRIVLVGFVDVDERNCRPGCLGEATKEWGRNDVREYFNRRRTSLLERQKAVGGGNQPRWRIKNWRYLPKGKSRSSLGKDTLLPPAVLRGIEARASPERIRKLRLRTEDRLLRDILLPSNERGEKEEAFEFGELLEVDNLEGMGITEL